MGKENMRILFLDWNSYGNLDILSAANELKSSGRDIQIELYPFDNHIERDDKQFAERFKKDLQKKDPDFVMSFGMPRELAKSLVLPAGI